MSVFHLKYRPLTLHDLDLTIVVKNLTNLLSAKEIPQALLFSGPKGAGKTSAARIVARALNCEKTKGVDPCGKCPSCLEILTGNSLDVVEIDAASNRGIEEARSLKDRAYLSPARLKKKVFVIDEVHMMTRDAFNALLKLLEEPPKQTVFILCTTDEEKIPETVLSRLIKVRFEKGGDDEMLKALLRVVDGEGIKVSKKSLKKIVDSCDRSFRNLHKLFNELFLEIGSEMTDNKVDLFLGTRLGEYSPELFENDLASGQLKEIMTKLEIMAKSGVDFQAFRERLIGYFQTKLLEACGVSDKGKVVLSLAKLEKLLQLLISAGKMETDSFIPQLPLQLVIVEFLEGKQNGEPKKADVSKNDTETPKVKVLKITTQSANVEESTLIEEKIDQPAIKNVSVDFNIDRVSEDWGKVLIAVKPFNHSVEAFLRAVRPIKISGGAIICEVFYPFHKDKLEEAKNRQIVEQGFKSVFGVELTFECVLAKSKLEPIVVKNDTPEEVVAPPPTQVTGDEMYDVAKQIFG
ncbi:DNA polymerase III subunit gamma/tau [Candidatus Shapirobacteria bacterium]|nr:DNA polymerase III subunit gamma/tau [Candidatus Shapirobacteria bacterium]